MTKFTAADLFCGALQKPHLFWSLYPLIQDAVASGAQYPKHVAFVLVHSSPCPVAFEFRLVSNLEDAGFFTGWNFARGGYVVVPFAKSGHDGIPAVHPSSVAVVGLHCFWEQFFEPEVVSASGPHRAFRGTVFLVGASLEGPEELTIADSARDGNVDPHGRFSISPSGGCSSATGLGAVSLAFVPFLIGGVAIGAYCFNSMLVRWFVPHTGQTSFAGRLQNRLALYAISQRVAKSDVTPIPKQIGNAVAVGMSRALCDAILGAM